MTPQHPIRLPDQWPDHVKSGILHAIALAATTITAAHAHVARRHRLRAALDQAHNEIALLNEELAIKDGRWGRANRRKRPHYQPPQRLRILQLQAARGWTAVETARRFLIDLHTLQLWKGRLEEHGERELLQTRTPVNRYPAFVRYLVRNTKRLFPAMGNELFAQILGRAGLVLSASTVRRFVREPFEPRDDGVARRLPRRAVARRAGEVWHCDFTAVPRLSGFWAPWFPGALPQRWPFCYWAAVVVDQYSRRLIEFEVFRKLPSAQELKRVLDRALRQQGFAPRCLVTDKGSQFKSDSHRRWCKRHGVRRSFGYLGEPCSIPIVERFIRTMKQECVRLILVPPTLGGFRRELSHFRTWYNEHRPHSHLEGKAPEDVYRRKRRQKRQRFEPRDRWPHRPPGIEPGRFEADVSYVAGRKHLPVIKLRRAA